MGAQYVCVTGACAASVDVPGVFFTQYLRRSLSEHLLPGLFRDCIIPLGLLQSPGLPWVWLLCPSEPSSVIP